MSKMRARSTLAHPLPLAVVPLLTVGACSALVRPPAVPDPDVLGCYRLETTLPSSYADSLGYELPAVFQLRHTRTGQWTVVPTDPEWHPDWTIYDALPSGYVRRQTGYASVGPLERDSIKRIPGDSIDVRFPGPIGRLVLRLGRDGRDLRGRAEWVVRQDEYFLNEGAHVAAIRTSCSDLRLALRRTR